MSNAKKSILIVAVSLCVCLSLVACAPKASENAAGGSNSSTSQVADGAGAYESDEKCLSCHGGSYEALAAKTSSLGDWNPHDPLHGGYNSCGNCHAQDREITNNYCTKCHAYAPDERAS